jgi:hypothetical protein
MYDLQILPTQDEGWAWGINNTGSVAGRDDFYTKRPEEWGYVHATIWSISSPSQRKTFAPPSEFFRINDAGDAIGGGSFESRVFGGADYLLAGNDLIELKEIVSDFDCVI